jgi:diguanylate cyclase (GGDEF)-like protein
MEGDISVLVVDDEESLLQLIKNYYHLEGYQCKTATSAEAALELIEEVHFNVILVDIVLPGMHGFELVEKVKQMKPDVAAIIMTGFVDVFSYDRAIDSGASDFLKKPFTANELLIRTRHVIKQEKFRSLAITDELTGLLNRRGFFSFAQQQLKISKRTECDFSLLSADLDNLKTINDTFGHAEGDRALVETSNILKITFRDSDIVGRIGGDEFATLLIGLSDSNFRVINDRMNKNIHTVNAKNTTPYEISLSVGIAKCNPQNPGSIEELLARSDEVMYENKKKRKFQNSGLSQ